jgi:hypothetical protein
MFSQPESFEYKTQYSAESLLTFELMLFSLFSIPILSIHTLFVSAIPDLSAVIPMGFDLTDVHL